VAASMFSALFVTTSNVGTAA